MINVMIAEDHILVRDGIRHLLENSQDIIVIAQAKNGREAVEEYKRYSPDVTILDIAMPGMDGLEACKNIKSAFPYAKILILTVHPEEEYAARCLKAGALGYITKMASSKELQDAVRYVAHNQLYIPDGAKELVMSQLLHPMQEENNPVGLLSDRELQVFNLLVHGKKIRDIAENLSLSVRTIENYRYRIFKKLNIRRTVDLVAFAYRHNFIQ